MTRRKGTERNLDGGIERNWNNENNAMRREGRTEIKNEEEGTEISIIRIIRLAHEGRNRNELKEINIIRIIRLAHEDGI